MLELPELKEEEVQELPAFPAKLNKPEVLVALDI